MLNIVSKKICRPSPEGAKPPVAYDTLVGSCATEDKQYGDLL
jgi:hypothetical protein